MLAPNYKIKLKRRSTAARCPGRRRQLITDKQTIFFRTCNSSRRALQTDGRTDGWTDRRTDGRYQVHYLPRFAVDKYDALNTSIMGIENLCNGLPLIQIWLIHKSYLLFRVVLPRNSRLYSFTFSTALGEKTFWWELLLPGSFQARSFSLTTRLRKETFCHIGCVWSISK